MPKGMGTAIISRPVGDATGLGLLLEGVDNNGGMGCMVLAGFGVDAGVGLGMGLVAVMEDGSRVGSTVAAVGSRVGTGVGSGVSLRLSLGAGSGLHSGILCHDRQQCWPQCGSWRGRQCRRAQAPGSVHKLSVQQCPLHAPGHHTIWLGHYLLHPGIHTEYHHDLPSATLSSSLSKVLSNTYGPITRAWAEVQSGQGLPATTGRG